MQSNLEKRINITLSRVLNKKGSLQGGTIKTHVKELNIIQMGELTDLYHHHKEISNMVIKRSGTGITVLIEVQ